MQKLNAFYKAIGFIIFSDVSAEPINTDTELEPVLVIAHKTAKSSESSLVSNSNSFRSPNAITPQIAKPDNNTHSTQEQLNNLEGVSILGSSQAVSQNISLGGLNDNNIFVGIDGVNNYFASFGHGHGDNQARLLPDPFLFKEADISISGADISYGSGNLGGAINFVTLDPSDLLQNKPLSTKVGLGVNSVTNGQTANLGLAAQTGKVSYLLAATIDNSNNTQLSNNTTLPDSANQNFQGLAKLNIEISQTQALKLAILQMQNQGLYPAIINNPVNEDNPTTNFALRQSQFSLDYNYQPLNNPYIKLQTKLYYLNNYYQSLPTTNSIEALPQQINMNTSGLKLQNQTHIVGQDLLYGIEYTTINGADNYNTNTMLNFPSAEQKLSGLFLQDSWNIIKELNITGGTRYNGYSSKSGNLTNSGNFFTNQLALNYNFLPDWSSYLAYTQGFAIPTLQNLFLGGIHPYEAGGEPFMLMLPNPNLKPQIGQNKALGIKYSHQFYPGHTINAGVSAYLNDVSNYILNSYVGNFDGISTIQNTNIAKAQLYGYSLSVNYNMPFFSIDTNFTQGYGRTLSNYSNDHGDFIAGAPLPIPQAKGYTSLGFPIRSIASIIKLNFNYAFNQSQTLPETPTVNGYFLTGINYSWNPQQQMKGFNVTAGIDNLFNSNYQQYDGLNIYPGLTRNLYLQASYHY